MVPLVIVEGNACVIVGAIQVIIGDKFIVHQEERGGAYFGNDASIATASV